MMKFWKKFNFIFIISTIIFGSFLGFSEEIRIVAIVNEDVITSYDLDQAMVSFQSQFSAIKDSEQRKFAEEKGQLNILEDMIKDRLLDQEMERLSIRVIRAEIDEELQRITKRSGLNLSQFENILRNRNLTMAQYRKTLEDHLRLLKFIGLKIRSKIQINEESARFYYGRNLGQFSKPTQVHLLQVSLSAKISRKKESEIRNSMINEVSVVDLKKKYKNIKIYDLGLLNITDLNKDVQPLISSVEEGQLSTNISLGDERNFYQVLKKSANEPIDFEEVKDAIRSKLFEREIEQQLDLYIRNLRNTAHVEVKI